MASPNLPGSPYTDAYLGVLPPELDQTQEPALGPPGTLERILSGFSGLENQPQQAPQGFWEGLLQGAQSGLGSAGTRALARRQKLEASSEARRLQREEANRKATAEYRASRGRALGEIAKEQRTGAARTQERQAEYERDNPVITQEMIAAAPAGSPLKRIAPGTRVAKSVLDAAQLREAPQEPLVAIEGPNGPVLVPRSQAVGNTPAKTTQTQKPRVPTAGERISLTTDVDILSQISGIRNAATKAGAQTGPVRGRILGTAQKVGLSNEAGRNLRARLAGLRNQILKARSGGAVTEGEAARLLEEIPVDTDPTSVLASKLNNFESVFRNIAQARRQILEGTGVDLSKIPALPGAPSPQSADSQYDPADLEQ